MAKPLAAALCAALLPTLAAAQSADLLMRADALARETEPLVIAWRRQVHQNPELSYQETATAAMVAKALAAMPGMRVKTGIAKTGVKGVLVGGKPGPVIALRADMDALPVEEKTGLAFASRVKATWRGKESFVAHACGHDAHVAMLVGAPAPRKASRVPGSGPRHAGNDRHGHPVRSRYMIAFTTSCRLYLGVIGPIPGWEAALDAYLAAKGHLASPGA